MPASPSSAASASRAPRSRASSRSLAADSAASRLVQSSPSWSQYLAPSTGAWRLFKKITKKLGLFKKLGWSQEDLSLSAKNMPSILAMGEKRLRQRMKFLTEDVGLAIPYIAQRPALMFYSIERRLLPRHCLINVLKRNGLLKINYDFYSTAIISNEKFLDKFVHPYVESVPGIGDAYASSCSGCGVDQLKLLSKDKIMC